MHIRTNECVELEENHMKYNTAGHKVEKDNLTVAHNINHVSSYRDIGADASKISNLGTTAWSLVAV